MKQNGLANELGVSKAYISMVMSGKNKPSKRLQAILDTVVNEVNQTEAGNGSLTHARLPIPTLPRTQDILIFQHSA